MPKNAYECMFILDANAYARNPGGAADSMNRLVADVGGEMLASRLWNEQKLAYPIKGRHKGAYWLTYARIDSRQLSNFNRACQLTDIVLRHLVVKIEPRLVETLVSLAKGEVAAPTVDVDSEASAEEPGNEDANETPAQEAAAVDG